MLDLRCVFVECEPVLWRDVWNDERESEGVLVFYSVVNDMKQLSVTGCGPLWGDFKVSREIVCED